MFAGKTTRLIQRVRAWEAAGGRVVVIKPAWDRRYQGERGDAQVITHDGASLDAHAAGDVAAADVVVRGVIGLYAGSDTRADQAQDRSKVAARLLVVVDEAHFFGAPLGQAVIGWMRAGASVLVCGVELDHRGEPFEPFPSLLAHADEVVKLASRCAKCGGPARHSQRMSASDERIVVGGAEMYEARCRACFEAGT
jgi:thymidine kinase